MAPLECRTKRWPTKAQSGAWRPGCPGGSPILLYAQRRARPYHAPRHRRTGLTLAVSPAGSGVRRQELSRSARSRPLLELARAAGQTLLLTTHFSGADEGRLEGSGNTMVATLIVNQGKVVRPSQLIASVLRTSAPSRADEPWVSRCGRTMNASEGHGSNSRGRRSPDAWRV
jgi:hypothetical protein